MTTALSRRKPRRQTPSYRRHRASGQAIVTLSGRDFYLGPYGTQVSRDEYDRLVAEWLANGRVWVNASQHIAAEFLRIRLHTVPSLIEEEPSLPRPRRMR